MGRSRGVKPPYDISEWVLDNEFLDKEEIKYAYKYLKQYMWSTFNVYDDEIVHRTIIRALQKSHLFDPSKASKWTWMAKILWNYYVIDKKQVKPLSIDNKFDDVKTFAELIPEVDVDEVENLSFVDDIEWIIRNTSSYPLLALRLDGHTYQQISLILDEPLGTTKSRIYVERKKLYKHLLELGDEEMLNHLNGRSKKGM